MEYQMLIMDEQIACVRPCY